jgi:hypothetical protein
MGAFGSRSQRYWTLHRDIYWRLNYGLAGRILFMCLVETLNGLIDLGFLLYYII